jgi:hypothetical protein
LVNNGVFPWVTTIGLPWLKIDLRRQRVDVCQCAAQIVAVKPLPDTEILFGLIPRAKDEIALRASDGLDGFGIRRRIAVNHYVIVICWYNL